MIPHRYPFLLIDRVLQVEAGKRATGIKAVTYNEPYFTGQSSFRPVMPGVLVIEAMAQLSAVLATVSFESTALDKAIYFLGISGARFRREVIPGDQLRIDVSLKHDRGNVWRLGGVASVNAGRCVEATLTGAIVDSHVAGRNEKRVLNRAGAG